MPAEGGAAGSAPFSDSRRIRDEFARDVGRRSTDGKGAPAAGSFLPPRAAAARPSFDPGMYPNRSARFSIASDVGLTARGGIPKKYQEDAIAIDRKAPKIDDPERFFRDKVAQMQDDNRDNPSGSTASMYYFDPQKGDITIANLGDSRVYLTVKYGDEYRTILLTQDHSPSHPKVQAIAGEDLVAEQFPAMGGRPAYIKYSIKHKDDPSRTYGVGGAIGDNGFSMLREPDIFTINIKSLAKTIFQGAVTDESQLEFVIINACDGLTNDARDQNYDWSFFDDNGEISITRRDVVLPENGLSNIVKRFWDEENLSKKLADDANQENPGDNVSVSSFKFMASELGPESQLHPVVGVVFDGHSRNTDIAQSTVQTNCLTYIKREINSLRSRGSAAAPARAAAADLSDMTEAEMMAAIARDEMGGSAAAAAAPPAPPASMPQAAAPPKYTIKPGPTDGPLPHDGVGEGEEKESIAHLTEEEQIALAMANSMAEGGAAAPAPVDEEELNPAELGQMDVNNAIERIAHLMLTPKTEPDPEILAAVEDELKESTANLNRQIATFFDISPRGSKVSIQLKDFKINGNRVGLNAKREVLVDGRPLIEELRRTLHKTYVAKYQDSQQYQDSLLALKDQSLVAFSKDGPLPLLAPGLETDFSGPLSVVQIAQSQEIVDSKNYELQEHVAAFQLGVEENFDNPKPTTPYRGIGAKVDVVEEGLKISEIFSPDIVRFKLYNTESRSWSFVTEGIADIMQGSTITHVVINGDYKEISELLRQGEEGKKQIAAAFHSNDKVGFRIEREDRSVYDLRCDNSQNKSAIFCPTAPTEPNPPEGPKPTFRALSQGLESEYEKHYYETCDRVIKRGSLFTNHLYEDSQTTQIFVNEMRRRRPDAQHDSIPTAIGLDTEVYKMVQEDVTRIALSSSNPVSSNIPEYFGTEEDKKLYKASVKELLEAALTKTGSITYPAQIVFPVNSSGIHWSVGEIFLPAPQDGKVAAQILMRDPLVDQNEFSKEAIKIFEEVLRDIIQDNEVNLESKIQDEQEMGRQHKLDGKSCGTIIAREMVDLFCGQDLVGVKYPPSVPAFRIQDLKDKVLTSREVEDLEVNRIFNLLLEDDSISGQKKYPELYQSVASGDYEKFIQDRGRIFEVITDKSIVKRVYEVKHAAIINSIARALEESEEERGSQPSSRSASPTAEPAFASEVAKTKQ